MKLDYSLAAISVALGSSRETVRRRLAAKGHKGPRYSLRQIVEAWQPTSLQEAKARREAAEARIKEVEADAAEENSYSRADVEELIRAPWLFIRQSILQMPAELCHKVNPSDPQHALSHLEGWVNRTLAAARENVDGEE